ncbi:MAG TPA: hypothetical protein ENG03_00615 [Thioploca sp.]|nr:MAG: hypothetical protein DRR19_13225 [Gammaproteobacteria bacterium]HDN25604.1 hypothetical protein [Thioploca sp.]
MQIKSFKFDEHKRNWHIEETVFDNFNLLVGISGSVKPELLKHLNWFVKLQRMVTINWMG